jgi:hypothetical protein
MGRVNRNALRRFEKNDPGATVFLAARLAKVLGYKFDICLKTKPLLGSTARAASGTSPGYTTRPCRGRQDGRDPMDFDQMTGWWSVKLVTALVLVVLALAVRFQWDVIRESLRGQLGWGIMKRLNRYLNRSEKNDDDQPDR